MNESLLLNIDVRLNLKISYLEGSLISVSFQGLKRSYVWYGMIDELLFHKRFDSHPMGTLSFLYTFMFSCLPKQPEQLWNKSQFLLSLQCNHGFTASLFYNRWMNMDKKIPEKELLNFYTTCISPILEYASPVFHNALPKYLEIEKLQRRALTIIYPWWPDSDALKQSGLSRLSERRQHLTSKLFSETTQDPTNSLRSLLLPENNCRYQFRRKRTFIAPRTKPIG